MNGTLSGIIAIAMWSFLATLIVFSGGTSPLTLTALSLFVGAVVLIFFNIYKKEDFKKLKKISVFDYLFVFYGVCFYTALIYISFKLINPVEANILNYLWPMFLGVFSTIYFKNKISIFEIIGLAISFAGVLFLFYNGSEDDFLSNISLGHYVAITAAIIWAMYSTLAREREYPQIIMVPVFLFSAFICFVMDYFMNSISLPFEAEWISVLILGLFRISYAFWDYGMKKGNTLMLSSLSYMIPLLSFGVLWIFGISHSNQYILLSVILVTAGCFLTNYQTIKKWVIQK